MSGKSGLVPAGDVRLGANISQPLHLKLKMASAITRTTMGELIESLIAHKLDEIITKGIK
jgi:hypothetical protein